MPIYNQGSTVTGSNTGDQIAVTVPNTPAGNIASTNVQAAINELDTEKAPLASPSFTGTINAAGLTASQAVVTDGSKNLASLAYASAATASALVQRDSNANIIANKVSSGIAINAPGGTTTVNLTAASAPVQYLTTSVIFTEVLPNATTLNNGDVYSFVCVTATSFAVNTFGGGGLLTGIPVGWRNEVQLQDNSTTAGTWKIINTCPLNGTYPLTQFATFGSTPSSTGASTSTRNITLQPASASFPGGVSTLAQSFAGLKTFQDGINITNLTGSQVVVTDASKNLASLGYGTTATASILVQRDANGTIVPKTPNDQTGTTYTFVITDAERTVTANNAAASTCTIPLASSVAFTVGTRIKLINKGVGAVGVIKSGSDTLLGNPTVNQYAVIYLEKLSESAGVSTWHIFAGTATVTEVINGSAVGTIVNQAYDISVRMPFSGTLMGITTKSTTTSVAGTYTVAISGNNVTGLTTVANGASGVRTNTPATAANTFVTGDYITITLAGVTMTDLFWSLEYTRAY
jgi:Tfp pilus assembly protein PilN